MEQLHANIGHLEHKLTQLKDRYNQQKLLIEKLKQENERLKRLSQQQQKHVSTDDLATIQSVLRSSTPKNEPMQQLLAQYIEQIDQCIKYLEQT